MKLLIVTQALDEKNPVLGFFVNWVREFSKNFEKVTVIALEVGEYQLPENVTVLSLGKEKLKIENWKLKITSRLVYAFRFYKYIFQHRQAYDVVLVHMNQEYVLLAGDLWRLLGKQVYLWRNHAKGTILTDMAVWMAHKVFYTSPSSYTAKFPKAVQMPVGIDTEFFKPDPAVVRIPNSVLFLGRISPVKKVLEFIDWVEEKGCATTIAGPILPQDREYGERVKLKIENSKLKINYVGPVDQEGARRLYQTHETYVNLTPAGSMDKTIFEASACGMRVEAENKEVRGLVNKDQSLKNLGDKLFKEIYG